jgi:MFS family permease
MISPLRNRSYRLLFGAQVCALLGTGLITVALALMAHEIAGRRAGEILGMVLAIKMVAYVTVAPFASALAARLPRKGLLVGLDAVRVAIALLLPFVQDAWQIYGLVTVLFTASAAFTPAFQALIPDILPDEDEYTKALSLSRLAAELESVASPVLAALLLFVLSWSQLFAGTALGFAVSAALVMGAALPGTPAAAPRPFLARLGAGMALFVSTPRLRAVFMFGLATAAGGAMVLVNTVTLVQTRFAMSEQATAWALAFFGAGSIAAALILPMALTRFSDRVVMTAGAALIASTLALGSFVAIGYAALAALWFLLGSGYSLTLTPVGRALRRSSSPEDRPALFAAQFALSHAWWLIAYPAAGLFGVWIGLSGTFAAMAVLALASCLAGWVLWSSDQAVKQGRFQRNER